MNKFLRDELIEYFAEYVTEHKISRIKQVLGHRTRYLTLVLEDIYQPHNANATLRTVECLGIQDIHIIENENEFKVAPVVTQGASKWLNLNRYRWDENNTKTCLEKLRANGYRIFATTPHATEFYTLDTIPLDQKMAIMFGNEGFGLTEYAIDAADDILKIPIYGFTESYNISVSVAITFSHIIKRLHNSEVNWGLTEEEKKELTLKWYKKIVRRSDLLEKKYLQERE